ncbi:MAG: hypothetical protein HGGPFJEG_02935 [Ignavibacteria bacterium]|nr:hypothetical protein [Ignavibacteria bacterium]
MGVDFLQETEMVASGFQKIDFDFMIKKLSVKILAAIILLFCYCSSSYSQGNVLSEGEELVYVVSYGFIKLGEVKISLSGKKYIEGKEIYFSKATMKTYSGIPFVSLNSVFESEMIYENNRVYSRRFKAVEYKEDGILKIEYAFNYDSNFVHVIVTKDGRTDRDEKIKINQNVKFQDGLSLFYCARLDSYSEENFMIPVFMNEAETSVKYYFNSQKEETSASIFDDDIKTIRCNGNASFKGVFGLTGEFAGWFSDDEARIPIKSQMNVMIGSVTLELESYKRKNWH